MQEKECNRWKGVSLMLVSSLCVCFGQLFWKLSSGLLISFLLAGFTLYAIGALLMLLAYRFGQVSELQPLLSFSYVVSVVLASVILGETISVSRIIGVCLVSAGVVLIGRAR